jgi:hypothetical protein
MSSENPEPHGSSRRRFIQQIGVAGLGGAALAGGSAASAGAQDATSATGRSRGGGRPGNATDERFTVVVIPDTQYQYDEDRGDEAPLTATMRWIVEHADEENIAFVAHLGDLTQNGLRSEFSSIDRPFRILDRRGIQYSVLAGNHDKTGGEDDTRPPGAYLEAFGPARIRRQRTFGGATANGYNTYHVFRAAGRDWLTLALDWRPSAPSIAWAQSVIDAHRGLPVILTTHELVYPAGDDGGAELSDFGRSLWDGLIAKNDQIFLAVGGHYWPTGRTVAQNAAGHDVHLHIANYQDRYYGGAAAIRLYRFDLARGVVDVESFSPWLLEKPAAKRSELEREETEHSGPADRFSLAIPFAQRFSGFAPVPARPARPARDLLVRGTLAYWRFDGGADGTPVPEGTAVQDVSGNGNHLTRRTMDGSGAEALRFSAAHHPDQPAHGSLRLDGGRTPARGAWLSTADGAALNRVTLERGYTIETFLWLPADWGGEHGFTGVLSRFESGKAAGKTADDPLEAAAALNVSGGGELQWAVFPKHEDRIATNWGHEFAHERWWHVAVVNDGRHTTLWADGSPLLRNPARPAVGIAGTGRAPWLVGASAYDGKVEAGFYGGIGDMRIVGRALDPREFLIA